MHFLLLCLLTINSLSEKVIEARFTDAPPKIDGVIEEVWHTADSVSDFVQFVPYEKEQPTERTVVYVLQDKDNLYFLFHCYAQKHKPIACLTADEDNITIAIDPFGSKTTAYYFIVYASGIIHDGWVLDNGRTKDDSWEGIWYRAVKLYDDRFNVELKIPFKSIRYKKGLNEWGITFVRYMAHNKETDCWNEFLQAEGDLVSKYGTMTDINPQTKGYYFELFPEGFVRYDKYAGEEGETKLRGSLNFKWDITSQTTVNATAYPDFAQIESDPFTLNLSRYPTYLNERRPFFLEGMDIFRMSDFGDDLDFFDPLNIFYSRRIGKSLNGDAVPIIGGLKLTHKIEKWNFGVLGAYTDSLEAEPKKGFGVIRLKRQILENSDIGMLFSGMMADKDNYNYALGIDGVYRNGFNQFIIQTALSERDKKKGWALSTGYIGFIKDFKVMASSEVVHDSFDVGDIGFVPWAGMKKLFVSTGPFKVYKKGFLKNLFYGPGIIIIQESGDNENWSKFGYFSFNPNFRNNWGFNIQVTAGSAYEEDTKYFYHSLNFNTWGNIAGQFLNLGSNYSYNYNYRRGFLANQMSVWFRVGYSIIPEVSLSLNGNNWVEWDTLNSIVAVTTVATPRLDIRFGADISLSIFNQLVFETPEVDVGRTDLSSNRIGLLFAWNFKPKSWFYIALNDYRVANENGKLQLEDRIGEIKAKYLIYF